MKKLKYLLLIIPFMFINSVKAEDLTIDYTSFNYVSEIKEVMGVADFNENITDLINVYNSNYQSTYPYYAITLDVKTDSENNKKMYFYLWVFKEKPKLKWYISSIQGGVGVRPYNWVYLYLRASATDGVISKSYSFTQYYKDEFDYSSELQFIEGAWILDKILSFTNNDISNISTYYNPYQFYYANFDLQVSDITKASYYEDDKSRYSLGYSNYLIPKIDSPGVYNVIARNRLNYMVFEPYYKYDKDIDITVNPVYQEIDLNSYPYIALLLKDYSKIKGFDSTVYVKGQLCITPVYNYGLKSYDEISGAEVSNTCSLAYDDFTMLRFTVTEANLKNNAIYYLKAYDASKENKIRVDTSVFNIHYITEEEKNSPILSINGKNYNTLPFDNLPSSANDNTENGYVPGGSCAVGDLNCTSQVLNGVSWSDIFSSPIKFIEGIWSSVTQVFTVIGYFISLLPVELQYFLYISFMLAIILGIIKIIL